MRYIRLSLVALVLTSGFLAVPTAAYASEGGETTTCLKEIATEASSGELKEGSAEFDEKVTNCFSAPSPVVPAWNEVLWGGLAFAIVAAGLIKFGFPAVKKGLTAREDKIREDLSSAENSKQDAAAKAAEYDGKLKDARTEATRIIEEAKGQAVDVKAGLVAKAEEEAASIRAKALTDAEAIASRALSDIQDQVAELSVDLAEKVVKSNMDKKSQLALVNSFIADLAKSPKN